MPFYSFYCDACSQEFTEWHRSFSGDKSTSYCPNCGGESLRAFHPANRFTFSEAVRKRVEKGMEPHFVKKDKLEVGKKAHTHHAPSRPWQVGH